MGIKLMWATATFVAICLMFFVIAKCSGVQFGTPWCGLFAFFACAFGSLLGLIVFNEVKP